MNSLIPPANSEVVSLLFFYDDGFGIKLHLKTGIPLNQTKAKIWIIYIYAILFFVSFNAVEFGNK